MIRPIIFLVVLLFHPILLSADSVYLLDPKQSAIEGSVKYAVVGTYHVHFKDFSGILHFDPRRIQKSSVTLSIQMASVQSNFPVLDKIARSKRVLDTDQYPEASFESTRIEKQGEGTYRVTGILNLHGVQQEIAFPFRLELDSQDKILIANGQWVIPRKQFNIIWDKTLDKGGVLVGDNVTLKWKIVARISS